MKRLLREEAAVDGQRVAGDEAGRARREEEHGTDHLVGLAEPQEIVGAVLFLSSRASAMVTGHTLAVDGGYLAQ